MTKPRILFITPLPPPVHGSSMVSKQIQDSEAVGEAFDCDFVNLSLSRRMDEIQSFSLVKILRLFLIYIKVLFRLLTRRYDMCYCAIACFGTPFLKDAPVVLLCKLFGRKVLIHQHNKGMSGYCHKPIYRRLYRLVYHRSRVMLLSWRLYDDIKAMVKREQVCICPNGVPAISSRPVFERQEGAVRLLYLSNLIPSKGCNVLLDALALLRGRGLQFHCDFIGGDCPEQSSERFEALIKEKGLGDCAVYHGRKYGEEKEQYWRRSDIFVFPTFYAPECFPVVLLEAMQHGLPCVTTGEAAIPDIIEDGANGLLCRARDAVSLADSLERLVRDKALRERMGSEGFARFKEHFTQERFERTFVDELLNAI